MGFVLGKIKILIICIRQFGIHYLFICLLVESNIAKLYLLFILYKNIIKKCIEKKLTWLLGKPRVILTEHAQHVGQENAQVAIHLGLNIPLKKNQIHKVTSHKAKRTVYIPSPASSVPFSNDLPHNGSHSI